MRPEKRRLLTGGVGWGRWRRGEDVGHVRSRRKVVRNGDVSYK